MRTIGNAGEIIINYLETIWHFEIPYLNSLSSVADGGDVVGEYFAMLAGVPNGHGTVLELAGSRWF